MRITCQKCAAAYAVDDRLIGPKGIRAQCPRCRHLQVVQKSESAPGADAPAPAPVPAVAPVPVPAAPQSDSPGSRPPVAPAVAPVPAPAAAPRNDSPGSRPPLAPAPAAQAPAAANPQPPLATPSRAAALPKLTPPTLEPAQVVPTCRACGKTLDDPFDRALGICDDCRQKEADAGGPDTVQVSASIEAPAPRVKVTPFRIPQAPLNAARESPEPRRLLPWIAGGSAGAVVLVVLAGVLFWKPGLLKAKPAAPAGVPPDLESVFTGWKLSFVDLSGNSADLLAEGEAKLAADMPAAYEDAEEAFQKALLLDPHNDAAIAGYVLALSFGRGAAMDDETYDAATRLVKWGEHTSKRATRLLIAHANLLLSRPQAPGNVEVARSLAEEATNAAQGGALRAEALLAHGRTWLGSSSGLAVQDFDQALGLAPGLKRVYFYRALAHASAGEYQAAIADFEKRLSYDAVQWEALAQLALLYDEVGVPQEARRLYEAVAKDHPDDIRAKLPLAVLAYQVENHPAEAITALQALVRGRDRYEDRQVLEVFVHLAAAQRAAGKPDAARDAASEALKIKADDPAAHLQLFLLALDHNDPASAAPHAPFLSGHLGDSGLEKLLEGRLHLAEGKFPEALSAFEAAASLDPRRTDALLLAGTAAARAHDRNAAFRDLGAAANADPTRSGPRPVITRFYLQPGETLRGAQDQVIQLAHDADEVSGKLYEGLVLFHQGELDRADRLLIDVLSLDASDPLAHAYRALIALARNDTVVAKEEGGLAARLGRSVAVAHYANGAALFAAGNLEGAQRELREALSAAPGLLAAEVMLAELDVRRKDVDSARAQLARVVSLDPSYLKAKRALYALSR